MQTAWRRTFYVWQFDLLRLGIACVPIPQIPDSLQRIPVIVESHPTIQSPSEEVEERHRQAWVDHFEQSKRRA